MARLKEKLENNLQFQVIALLQKIFLNQEATRTNKIKHTCQI